MYHYRDTVRDAFQLSNYPSIYLSMYLSIYLSIYRPIYPSTYLLMLIYISSYI